MTALPDRTLTVRQPWADLIMAGVKDVENRSWPVPSTLPQWQKCSRCGYRPDVGCAPGCSDRAGRCVDDGPFPFTIGIHAAAKVDYSDAAGEAVRALGRHIHGINSPWAVEVVALHEKIKANVGVLLGTVTVTGCHHADECMEATAAQYDQAMRSLGGAVDEAPLQPRCSRWAEPGVWHWTLADPQPLDVPIPMKGRLGLWKPTNERQTL